MSRSIVITNFLTASNDPQRENSRWSPHISLLEPLYQSLEKFSVDLVVLHDTEWEDPNKPFLELIRVDPLPQWNPYFARWLNISRYLEDQGSDTNFVWCVDATDVIALRHPFHSILGLPLQGVIFVGSEPWKMDQETSGPTPDGFKTWMRTHHPSVGDEFYDEFGQYTMLNAGLLGGHWSHVQSVAALMFQKGRVNQDLTDMGVFNHVIYEVWEGLVQTGPLVHTPYKSDVKRPGKAIWKHK